MCCVCARMCAFVLQWLHKLMVIFVSRTGICDEYCSLTMCVQALPPGSRRRQWARSFARSRGRSWQRLHRRFHDCLAMLYTLVWTASSHLPGQEVSCKPVAVLVMFNRLFVFVGNQSQASWNGEGPSLRLREVGCGCERLDVQVD